MSSNRSLPDKEGDGKRKLTTWQIILLCLSTAIIIIALLSYLSKLEHETTEQFREMNRSIELSDKAMQKAEEEAQKAIKAAEEGEKKLDEAMEKAKEELDKLKSK